MKFTKIVVLATLALISVPAFAQDGVVKQDDQKIQQDRHDLRQDNQNVKTAKAAVLQDRSSGNSIQLVKDQEALKEARRNRREAKQHLHQDKDQKTHDVVNP
jgi:hypothetical protein